MANGRTHYLTRSPARWENVDLGVPTNACPRDRIAPSNTADKQSDQLDSSSRDRTPDSLVGHQPPYFSAVPNAA